MRANGLKEGHKNQNRLLRGSMELEEAEDVGRSQSLLAFWVVSQSTPFTTKAVRSLESILTNTMI